MPNEKLVDSMPSERVRMFSSFCTNPIGVTFAQQENDEKVLLFLRRHFITNVPWIVITIILIFLPLFILIFEANLHIFETFSLPARFTFLLTIFYYLMVLSYAFVSFITWFYNVFLVTQKRLADIDYHDIVIHNIAFTKLTHIQDVTYTQAGFLRSLFNYGDLHAQTAGAEINFEGLSVPKPREAAQIIADLIGRRAHAT